MIHFLQAHWPLISLVLLALITWIIYEFKHPLYLDDKGNEIKKPEVIHQCSWCKKWMHGGKLHDSQPVEASTISHGICPPCAKGFFESVNTTNP